MLYVHKRIEDMKFFANHHMKSRLETTFKYYIVNLEHAAKKALSFSVGMNNVLDEPTDPIVKEVEEQFKKCIKPVPLKDIPVDKLKEELKKRLKLEDGNDVDKDVRSLLNDLCIEEGKNHSLTRTLMSSDHAQEQGIW